MALTRTIPPVNDLLVEDDASKFSDGLSVLERRAHFETNGLGNGSYMFDDDEFEAMLNIFAPE